MTDSTIQKTSSLFGLLSDPTRLRILDTLSSHNGELCVNEIARAVDSSASATSHQLRKLELMGLVSKCRYGQEICYCFDASNRTVAKILRLIKASK